MKRQDNKEGNTVEFLFTGKELKRIKYGIIGLSVVFLVSVGTAVYSVFTMSSLRAENVLFRNQLKIAEEKMDKLSQKADTVDKISNDLKQIVQSGGTDTPGQGGASTVPDKASTEDTDGKTVSSPGELLDQIVTLDQRMDNQIKTIIALRSQILEHSYLLKATELSRSDQTIPSIWPVTGRISSLFGWRSSPGGGIGSSFHEGIDIANDYNTPIHATAAGTITQAGWVAGYGYLVEIQHSGGIVTRYGHNSTILVKVGDHVNQGDIISLLGSTGNSTGPHCHYEVRVNGTAVDPILFLPAGN